MHPGWGGYIQTINLYQRNIKQIFSPYLLAEKTKHILNKDPATCYIAAAAASVDDRLLHMLQPVLVPVERRSAVACKDSWQGSSCCTSPWPRRMRHDTGGCSDAMNYCQEDVHLQQFWAIYYKSLT